LNPLGSDGSGAVSAGEVAQLKDAAEARYQQQSSLRTRSGTEEAMMRKNKLRVLSGLPGLALQPQGGGDLDQDSFVQFFMESHQGGMSEMREKAFGDSVRLILSLAAGLSR
jgi:hypothetical protein